MRVHNCVSVSNRPSGIFSVHATVNKTEEEIFLAHTAVKKNKAENFQRRTVKKTGHIGSMADDRNSPFTLTDDILHSASENLCCIVFNIKLYNLLC